ncbi:MAG TPA: DUF1592 domain-containing protein [Bryobacteraceae bacterium]|nr:DUF1592 domain-containing protein [Bryobacteraceae bacterium]
MRSLAPVVLLFLPFAMAAEAPPFDFAQAKSLLGKHCLGCHTGKAAAGGFDLSRYPTEESLAKDHRRWVSAANRVRSGEMPPKGTPAPTLAARQALSSYIDNTLHQSICRTEPVPVAAPVRRLNRSEYAATIRDLLNIHFNAGQGLPADGAGGEGFDNAAETLFLSPVHAEKYLEAAKQALEYASKEPRARSRFIIAEPDEKTTPSAAAAKVLGAFLPRAFRRPVQETEIAKYVTLFEHARKRGDSYDHSILFALQGVLMSPHFLFRFEQPGDYEIASRLSYFLWGTMPDDVLFDLAAKGSLSDPAVLREQVSRMVKDARSLEFAERFVEQWLNTRELGVDIKPDAKLFPTYYDAELQSAIRYEPILFFQEVLANNHSLLTLLDSKFSFLTNKLAKHYGLTITEANQLPKKLDLPADSKRGGLLGMAAVLAVSSYPNRTSPVLRGKWVLENLLGTPPPPPPPDVPELPEEDKAAPKSLRERLVQHRQNPVCASCHDAIDPIGFGLETYNVLGQWRTEDAGKPVDSKGELPDGATFDGPMELKAVLLNRRTLFLRNLTSRMLGYALGRGLTLQDSCTVDQIVQKLEESGGTYPAQTLVGAIVESAPFRYKAKP